MLLTKIKTANIEKWTEWNKTTFELRQSMGLQVVRPFKDTKEPDTYFAISLWQNLEAVLKFTEDENIKIMLNTGEIAWYSVSESLPDLNLGSPIQF